jgi:hypothetical protein
MARSAPPLARDKGGKTLSRVAAGSRPKGRSALARIQLAPAHPSAEEQGTGLVAHNAEVASDAAGCATGEYEVSRIAFVEPCARVGTGIPVERCARSLGCW